MADFDNTNRGTMFFNTEKTNEKAPDYSINVNFKGQDFRISAWKKISKAGKKFISFQIEEGDGKQASKPSGDVW
jgi:uncharacterized protein (DUF736 family)